MTSHPSLFDRLSWIALVSAAAAGSPGCTPETKYRYTGYVPAARALAWDGRTAKDGTLRVEGTMSSTSVHRNLTPGLHDTALHVPNMTLEGSAVLAATSMVELGARYAYSAYEWGEPSAQGTMSLPSKPSVWGVGPEVRATLLLDKREKWGIGLAGNIIRYQTPYAEWQLMDKGATCDTTSNRECAFDPSAAGGGAYYRLNGEKSESHLTLNIAVYPSVALGDEGDLGHVFAGFAVHTTFKNDGFTDTSSSGSTIQDAGLIYIAGIGYGIVLDPFRVSAMLTLPLTTYSSSINYGPSGFVTVGVDLALWESRADRRKRLQMEEERRQVPIAPAPPPAPPSPPDSGEHPL